jgi:hypothetical protein
MVPSTADSPEREPTTPSSTRWRLESEDLHIRNRDQETGYDVEVTIRQGEILHYRTEYHLLPGQSGSSVNLLPTGIYDVTVTLNTDETAVGSVRVSDDPDETIAVEIRDGSARVRQGVQ